MGSQIFKFEKNESDLLENKNEEVENEKKFENSILSLTPIMPLSANLRRDHENYISNRNIITKQTPDQLEEKMQLIIKKMSKINHICSNALII